jgi:hypothetical protein
MDKLIKDDYILEKNMIKITAIIENDFDKN